MNFDGYTVRQHSVDLPNNQLNSPQTELEFTTISAETIIDRQAVGYVTIQYERGYDFEGMDHFALTIDDKETGNYLAFENLEAEAVYWLYDNTHHIKIKLNYDAEQEIHQAYLPAKSAAQRRLLLQKEDKIKVVDSIKAKVFIDYSQLDNQGDYIFLTHRNLVKKEGGLINYINYRASNKGGNYVPVLVDVEALYDQYSYGIRKHPLAIKYFLNDAIENWERTPSHCLLLGKGINNSKCRTSEINWPNNLLPTFGVNPNDQYFGAANFSPLSRIAIGRLSVNKEPEIQHYLDKVIAVEQENTGEACSYIQEAQWKHQMFHLGGGDEVDQANLFAERLLYQANIAKNGSVTANTQFLSQNANLNETEACLPIEENNTPIDITPQDCIANVFNQGKRVINFLGHPSGLNWAFDIGEPEDYSYNQKYPVIISQSSFNGDAYKSYLDERQLSMPETWLNANKAGATAFIGFSLIYDMRLAADFIDVLYAQMFQLNPNLTLGEQLNLAIKQYYDADDLYTQHTIEQLVFSGDPALNISINDKPEVAITTNNIDTIINRMNEFEYSVELMFDYNSLNIASVDSIPYNIILLSGNTETEVKSGWLKTGEQGFFSGDFTLMPNQPHLFRIQLDYQNQFDEICEENNTVEFKAGEWVVDIKDDWLSANSISNYPNPFNTQTTFDITLSQAVLQQDNYLRITNLTGQFVHQIKLEKGLAQQRISWDGNNLNGQALSAGVYGYQLIGSGGQAITWPGRVVLIK